MADNVFKPRRGSSSRIRLINPILADGEMVIEYPDGSRGPGGIIKIGNGVTPYNDLPSFLDKGDFIDKKEIGRLVPPLNDRGIVDTEYLPDDIDNVEVWEQKQYFPTIGKPNKIYIDKSQEIDNAYRFDPDTDTYVKVSKSVTYELKKEGSSVVLKGTDGSSSTVSNVGGVEIRNDNPSPAELYPGKMWIVREDST